MMNDGNGHFPGIITYPIDWPHNDGKILAEDINNDDIIDLILYGMFYDIYIFTVTGFGNFNLTTELWTDYWSSDAEMGYFDEDSNIDLALINQNENKLRILSGNGSGSFQLTK